MQFHKRLGLVVNFKIMSNSKLSDNELKELGQKLQEFYELGYINKKSALGYSFLKGLASGLGVFLGGTLVVTITLWILGGLDSVPLVGPATEAIRRSITKN